MISTEIRKILNLKVSLVLKRLISTPEGKKELAKSMMQPLRGPKDYIDPCICCGLRDAELGTRNGCGVCSIRQIMES